MDLAGTPRGGVLTQASVLTVSSYATRTSPVLRGKWILENLLERAAAAAAAGRAAASTKTASARRRRCASRWRSTAPTRRARRATRAWTRWASASRTSTRVGALADDGRQVPDRRVRAAARRADVPRPERAGVDPAAASSEAFARALTAKLLTYALGRGLEQATTRGPCATIARRLPARTTASRAWYWRSCRACRSRCGRERSRVMIDHRQAPAAPHVPAGLGAAIALPLLDAMTPGACAGRLHAAPARLRLAFIYVPNGVTMDRLDAGGDGRGFEFIAHPASRWSRSASDMLVLSRPGAPERRTRSATARATMPAPRPASSPACIRRRPRAPTSRTASRSTRSRPQHIGAETRFAVARAGLRRFAHGRQLRLRLQLRLHQQHLLARPDDADAARDEPAAWSSSACSATSTPASIPRRARAALRKRRSILDLVGERTHARCRPARAGRPPQARRVPDVGPRDRAAHPDAPRRTRASVTPDDREADRHPGDVRRIREADVRPAGPRVPGRPDARRDVDVRPRGQPADAIRRSACPTRTIRSPTTGTTRSGSRRSRKINTFHMELFAYFSAS